MIIYPDECASRFFIPMELETYFHQHPRLNMMIVSECPEYHNVVHSIIVTIEVPKLKIYDIGYSLFFGYDVKYHQIVS